MKVKDVIEAIVGPSNKEIDEIMAIILKHVVANSSVLKFETSVNPYLKPYGIKFDLHDEELLRVGALARTEPGLIVFLTPPMRELSKPGFKLILSHELVHAEQLKRAGKTGAERMYASSMKRLFPNGNEEPMDRNAYFTDKQEVMAYAKSAVDKLIYDKVHPYDIVRMAKKGKINSPVLGHGKKTDDLFRRYVVAYAIKET